MDRPTRNPRHTAAKARLPLLVTPHMTLWTTLVVALIVARWDTTLDRAVPILVAAALGGLLAHISPDTARWKPDAHWWGVTALLAVALVAVTAGALLRAAI